MDKLYQILDLKKTKAFTPVNLENFKKDFNSQNKIKETFDFILDEVIVIKINRLEGSATRKD